MNWAEENPELLPMLDEFNFRRALNLSSDEYKALSPIKKTFWGAIIEAERIEQEKSVQEMSRKMKRHR